MRKRALLAAVLGLVAMADVGLAEQGFRVAYRIEPGPAAGESVLLVSVENETEVDAANVEVWPGEGNQLLPAGSAVRYGDVPQGGSREVLAGPVQAEAGADGLLWKVWYTSADVPAVLIVTGRRSGGGR